MRILVIGAGVLGCNLAANFYKAGKDVTILARGKWYETIKSEGLMIKNKFRIGTRNYPVNVISSLDEKDKYDVIFVSLRFNQLDSIVDTLNKNVTENIVFNGNNTRAKQLVGKLTGKNVMFSFAISAGSREAKRVNSIDLKKITIGDMKGNDNKAFINSIFEGTGYKVIYQPNMGDYLISHAAFVVPAAFACYYTDGNLKKIKKNYDYMDKVIKTNIECYEALDRLGFDILPEEDKEYSTKKWYSKCMKFYKLMCATSLGKICVSDHAMNAADEMQALAEDLSDMIDRAKTSRKNFDELWVPLKKMF